MLHSARLSLSFWELAADAAVHTYNRSPTCSLGWWMPYELWMDRHILDVSYFCIFRCKAYVHVPEDKQKKLDPQLIEMTLVGYEPGSKGYQLWNSSTQVIVLSCDVMFDECSYPTKVSSEQTTLPPQLLVLDGLVTIKFPEQEEQGPAPLETPANCPIPMRDSTVFHTPPSRPPAPLPLPHTCTAHIWRDPAHPLHSTLLGLSFGPPLLLLHQLQEHPCPNLKYFREDNAACKPQTGQLSHSALLVAAKYQDPLTFKEVMDLDLANQWQTMC